MVEVLEAAREAAAVWIHGLGLQEALGYPQNSQKCPFYEDFGVLEATPYEHTGPAYEHTGPEGPAHRGA
jgi:hypothetical protein